LSNIVAFESSLLFKLNKTDIPKSVVINDELTNLDEQSIRDLIGRGVFLEKSSYSDMQIVGQIVPAQPASCKKVNKIDTWVRLLE